MLTKRLAEHISSFNKTTLPPRVFAKSRLHLLDTVAAMVSGSKLSAGQKILPFVLNGNSAGHSSVIASGIVTSPMQAALANGMLAHADETDDSHAPSLTHPGCAIIPAALAIAEHVNCSGKDLVQAIVLGYDISTRIAVALGGSRFADHYHLSSHAWGGVFGATAASCALLQLPAEQVAHALSYAAQSASGNRCWLRDPDHIQKAFVFGGMPASNGVQAATFAQAGFTGVADAIEGTPGLFAAFREQSNATLATEELGERFEIMRTTIKKWSVGSPIQAALDCIETLCKTYGLTASHVASITVTLPEQRARVTNSAMPDINMRHILAMYLVDGGVSFKNLHDHDRVNDPDIIRVSKCISVSGRAGAKRGEQAHFTLKTIAGEEYFLAPKNVRGQPDNPMTEEEVRVKATDLILPVLGDEKSGALVMQLSNIQKAESIRNIRHLWQT